MNERLKELMLATGYVAPEIAGRAQKLAFLIIEECAKLAEYNGYNQRFGKGGLRSKLHEHFGVEE